MNVAQERLPLEYPPKEMLRIYKGRLLVFSAVVGANCIVILLAEFAMTQPVVFSLAFALVALFALASWLGSRNASLMTNRSMDLGTAVESPPDPDAIALASLGLWALLECESPGARMAGRTRHLEPIDLIGDLTFRELLERSVRFQEDVIASYCRQMADLFSRGPKSGLWLELAQMASMTAMKIKEAIGKIPSQDLSNNVRPALIDCRSELARYVLLIGGVPNLRMIDTAMSFMVVRWYFQWGPAVLARLQSASATTEGAKQIAVVEEALQELSEKLNCLIPNHSPEGQQDSSTTVL